MTRKKTFTSGVCSFDLPRNPGVSLVRLHNEKGGMRVAVLPEDGGGIASLQVRFRGQWHEILYRAMDYETPPPFGWTGRAPLLWPAVGRNFTPDQVIRSKANGRTPRACAYLLNGRRHSIRLHGFAMHTPWTLDAHGADDTTAWVTCRLADSPQTRQSYPFGFHCAVTYELTEHNLVFRYELEAGDNERSMPFGIGNHIGFNLPFTGAGSFEDCTIRTPGHKKYTLTPLVILSGRSEPLDFRKPVSMRDRPYDNNVVGGYMNDNAWAELSDPASFKVRISQRETSVSQKRISKNTDILFVLWGDSKSKYFCPEPWLGWPNSLNSGRGLLKLAPRQRFGWEVRLTIRSENQ